jgi:hypothetical protein
MHFMNESERRSFEKRLEDAPDVGFGEDWAVPHRPISELAATLALTWARLMEAELKWAPGMQVAQAATRTERDVVRYYNLEGGVHNVQFINAVTLLEKAWRHGPSLRSWHARTAP